jgi:hypothetical protein
MIDPTTANTQASEQQPQNTRMFNPNEHLMQIKNRGGASSDYLPVQWRLVWFRSLFPHGSIETEIVHLDLERETEEEAWVWNNETRRSEKVVKRAPGFAVFRATVKDGLGGVATGIKSEKAASFGDFLEKAETGAIGRALAALGYGTQFAGDEFNEQHRIVDAPVDRGDASTSAQSGNGATANRSQPQPAAEPSEASASTEQQHASIKKMCERLGKTTPQGTENMTYGAAKELIAKLSQEYRQARQKAS